MVGAGIRLLEAAGMDYVLVETVGVGQTDLDVRGLADTVVVTLVPDGGDSIQAMKAGLSEIADVFVVNKADRPGADRLAAHVAASLELDPPGSPWRPPVLELQAHRGVGVPALWDAIARHRQVVGSSALLERRRRARARQELASALTYAVEGRLADLLSGGGALREMAQRVESGDADPYSVAEEALSSGALLEELFR